MEVVGTELDLLQNAADTYFGGDVGQLATGLDRLDRCLDGPLGNLYQRVGNHCLVFFTNQRMMKVCEENPDTIQGVIVDDFDSRIDPGAVVLGSVLGGWMPTPNRVSRDSRIINSTLVGARVHGSTIKGSRVSIGEVIRSKITDSITLGSLASMDIEECWVNVGRIVGLTAVNRILKYDSREDRDDTDGFVNDMLVKYGLRAAASANNPAA